MCLAHTVTRRSPIVIPGFQERVTPIPVRTFGRVRAPQLPASNGMNEGQNRWSLPPPLHPYTRGFQCLNWKLPTDPLFKEKVSMTKIPNHGSRLRCFKFSFKLYFFKKIFFDSFSRNFQRISFKGRRKIRFLRKSDQVFVQESEMYNRRLGS